MIDPLSISASIFALLQATTTVISHLKDIRDAPQDRMDFLAEISGLHTLLDALHRRVRGAAYGDQLSAQLQALGVKDGALDQFMHNLNLVTSKLEPVSRLGEIGRRVTWRFSKREIKDILWRIERIKSLCMAALANDIFALSCAIKEETTDIKDTVEKLRQNQTSEEYRKILDWLSPLNFRATHSNIFQKREHGTGQWFLECDIFKYWRDTRSQALWCPGMPGAGKTFLTSIVVDHLRKFFDNRNDRVAVVCIYCNYKEQAEHTTSHLVESLLRQVTQDSNIAADTITSLYRRHEPRNTRPMLDELTKALKSEIGKFSKFFILVDALDECRDDGTREDLLGVLQSLAGVNIMVTSRDLPMSTQYFREARRLEIRASNQDVRNYVEGRIARAPRKHLKGIQDVIVKKLVENAGGMFLLARLHMDSLVGKPNVAAVRRALETLPKGVDDTYAQAIERIERQPQDDKDLARDMLMWVTYACRPLSVQELQHALAVTPGTTSIDPECITDKETLVSVCAGLVVLDEELSVVRLVHTTAQQYFENKREILFPAAQSHIAEVCLTYLSFDVFVNGDCHAYSGFKLRSLLDENPLLDYAARHWANHIHGGSEEKCRSMALQLLQNESKSAFASQVLFEPVMTYFLEAALNLFESPV